MADLPTDQELKRVSELVQLARNLRAEIDKLENDTGRLAERLRTVEEDDLPSVFAELGLSKVKLGDGTSVEIKPFVTASITEERAAAAFAWLRSHDHGDLIKNRLDIDLGRGEDDTALTIKKMLLNMKVPFEQKEAVHSSTLKAFVREQIKKGVEVPKKTFGIHIGSKATIKEAK